MPNWTRSQLNLIQSSLAVEREKRRRAEQQRADVAQLETSPQRWLQTLYPTYVRHPFAPRHDELWSWLWALERGRRPPPFVAVWPRGGAKSTTAELGLVAITARKVRNYGLYVCETQDQADDHVGNVAALLERPTIAQHYPLAASRAVGKYGNVKGWRRNRLRTASGFTLDALGLDSAARGAKIDEHRPDIMIIDDIDGELDSRATVDKKVKTLTEKLIPAGAEDLAVLAVQNLVHPDSVFAQLVDGRADFLHDRIVSGPHPALLGLEYQQLDGGKYRLTAGVPTWLGQDLARCQAMVNDMGMTAFLSECQQLVEAAPGGMFDHLEYKRISRDDVPQLVDVQVWCDPAVTESDRSDSHGIQVDGLGVDGRVYRLWSWERRASPQHTIALALEKAVEYRASVVGVEADQGGDTWASVLSEAWRVLLEQGRIMHGTARPRFRTVKASQGYGPKTHRANQMLSAYEQGLFIHVEGTHHILERALNRFPRTKPFDLTDAAFWSWQGVTTDMGDEVDDSPLSDYRG